jgi:GNAT superfamily N-acetyltransferase
MAITVRHALDHDDLAAIWPEITGPMNRLQIFVAEDEQDHVVGACIMFDGGHSIAYVGSTRIVATERRAWVARALVRFVSKWCYERNIVRVGHGAGTEECVEAFQRFGAQPGRLQLLMEYDVRHVLEEQA